MNNKAGLTFATALRSILRSDPDVVMVGEIRDAETAKISIEAALTGHFVLSTLHTNDAPSALTRLNEMGVEPFLTGSAVTAVLAQRLVRKLCTHCCEMYMATQEEMLEARFTPEQAAAADGVGLYRKKGCPRCNQTGYKGRVGVYQLMTHERDISRLAAQHASREEIERAGLGLGMKTLWDDGVAKVDFGLTSIEELARVLVLESVSPRAADPAGRAADARDVAAEVGQDRRRLAHEGVRLVRGREAVRARAERLDAQAVDGVDVALDEEAVLLLDVAQATSSRPSFRAERRGELLRARRRRRSLAGVRDGLRDGLAVDVAVRLRSAGTVVSDDEQVAGAEDLVLGRQVGDVLPFLDVDREEAAVGRCGAGAVRRTSRAASRSRSRACGRRRRRCDSPGRGSCGRRGVVLLGLGLRARSAGVGASPVGAEARERGRRGRQGAMLRLFVPAPSSAAGVGRAGVGGARAHRDRRRLGRAAHREGAEAGAEQAEDGDGEEHAESQLLPHSTFPIGSGTRFQGERARSPAPFPIEPPGARLAGAGGDVRRRAGLLVRGLADDALDAVRRAVARTTLTFLMPWSYEAFEDRGRETGVPVAVWSA